ncbi:TetR family transcriptional regulator [Gordoniibacillus kamchatkensis]|uniref:TetR family transcriptional regulator n=1 Tax=Gordoniibacillus kamchatkensis TaxID=1590651 RepID=A0ABR5AN47_9BACL|nr:TetR/AcrR family transcriptional regulator [Paenibacillus sp. VKM B-2647]KIL42396.1 TetR family transcriptional regulator [Paenibacillus sp. VKM B-2647]
MDIKERILHAAEQVIRDKGLARATTKEIARIAGCSEGSLYLYFKGKDDIFLQVTRGQLLPNFKKTLVSLPKRVGTGTVQETLTEVAEAALAFYLHSMPILASVFSEPELLTGHRDGFRERNEGPHRPNETVAAYLHAEQTNGRIAPGLKPRIVADLLLGACFQRAFQLQFLGETESKSAQKNYAENIVQTLFG